MVHGSGTRRGSPAQPEVRLILVSAELGSLTRSCRSVGGGKYLHSVPNPTYLCISNMGVLAIFEVSGNMISNTRERR